MTTLTPPAPPQPQDDPRVRQFAASLIAGDTYPGQSLAYFSLIAATEKALGISSFCGRVADELRVQARRYLSVVPEPAG